MGVQGRHQFHQVAFASPTTHLMTDCKEKTLRGRFIREVISIHLQRVTEEPVHSTVTGLQFERFFLKKRKKSLQSPRRPVNKNVYRWMW